MKALFLSIIISLTLAGCGSDSDEEVLRDPLIVFDTIDINNPYNYNAGVPNYVDRSLRLSLDDQKVTLGRILFYDNNLSVDNSISCSSCHDQSLGFSDSSVFSQGVNGGSPPRHSMRLINSRFSDEEKFFWDERASSIENQVIQPIEDPAEMGFSGGPNPGLDDLISKLSLIEDYSITFDAIYGDSNITIERIRESLAQFVLSIQSFDSKYDIGLSNSNGNNNADFSNFTLSENRGKELFSTQPNRGGAGCIACHRAPDFSIDPGSLNNGVISDGDLTITRSPSLRDIVNSQNITTPFMHTGEFSTLAAVIEHYNSGVVVNANLDRRLMNNNQAIRLNLTTQQKLDLENFIKTLTGSDVYTNEKWSDPF